MAYQAYQSRQTQQTGNTGGQQMQDTGGGSLIDDLRHAAQDFLGNGAASSPQPDDPLSGTLDASTDENLSEGHAASERVSEDEALLMIRAMITAAYSNGSLSQEERGRIMRAIEDADPTEALREVMEREIANPMPLDALLTQVDDSETAEEFYLASRAALDGDGEADRRYLSDLQIRLGISAELAEEANSIAS